VYKRQDVREDDVPDADIAIATFWNTAEWVANFSEVKGKKVYFIQHYEVHPWLPIDRVKATLLLPFKHIVVANWLKEVLLEQYGANDITVVANGVDHEQFYCELRAKQVAPAVGFFYSERAFKGCDVIVEAINIVRERYSNLRVLAMGMKKPNKEIPLPEKTEYFLNPPQNEIKNIYSQCDAWLFGSRSEGFGLTILEAMACRTPVIGTKAGAAPELLSLSEGELIDINDAEQMASSIIKYIEMSQADWQALSMKAYAVACLYEWDRSSALFEKALDEVYSS
ncbi:MAG: glycosyltransferase family 4 protein, partial [Proteobacteria bacterium]|nr:glycosyltransferase family 4 protein [Pseudomonadota bacterium]